MIKTDERFDIKFIDASRLSCFGRCEARFLFKCLMGLRSQDASMLPLDYGTVMHKVLPLMHGGDESEAFDLFDNLWAEFGYGEDDPKRNTPLSKQRIEAFVACHSPSTCPYEIMHFDFASPTELISENEIPFLIDAGWDYPLCGRIDMPVRWKATGTIWCGEFKTSSEISPRYFEGFWFSPAACAYTLALSQITDEKLEGMMMDVMRVSKTKIESQIGFVYVPPRNIEVFLAEGKHTIARMKHANETGCWAQDHALCSPYSSFGFPSRRCEYWLICDCIDWKDGARFYKREKPFNPLEAE